MSNIGDKALYVRRSYGTTTRAERVTCIRVTASGQSVWKGEQGEYRFTGSDREIGSTSGSYGQLIRDPEKIERAWRDYTLQRIRIEIRAFSIPIGDDIAASIDDAIRRLTELRERVP